MRVQYIWILTKTSEIKMAGLSFPQLFVRKRLLMKVLVLFILSRSAVYHSLVLF